MKTTKLLIFVMTIIMTVSSVSAQQAMTTTDSLMAYKWVYNKNLTGDGIKEMYDIYSINSLKSVIVFDVNHEDYDPDGGPIVELSVPYYISTKKDTSFRDAEVGKRQNGRFIIVKRKNDVGVYEIAFLSNTRLALKYWQSDIYSTVSIWFAVPK